MDSSVVINYPALIACFAALFAGVFLDQRFKLPLGVISYIAAFLIGERMLGMKSATLLGFMPASIVTTIILAMTFYGMLNSNGAVQYLGAKLLKPLKGKMALYPPLCFLISIACYFLFNMMAVNATIVPLLVLMGLQNGVSLPMIITPIYLGQLIGSQNPFVSPSAANKLAYLNTYGISDPHGTSIGMWVCAVITLVLTFVIMYIIFRGWKKGPDRPQYQAMADQLGEVEMTPALKKSLIVLVASIIVLVVPPLINTFFPSKAAATFASIFDVYNVFTVGILVCICLKIGDYQKAIKSIPVGIIVLICGVTTLMQVATKAGMVTLLQQITANASDRMMVPALFIMCAALSFFVSGSAVVPSLWPIISAVAKTPTQFIQLFCALYIGIAVSGISPLSSSGVYMLSMGIPEDLRQESTGVQFKIAILLPIVATVLTYFGSMAVASLFAQYATFIS